MTQEVVTDDRMHELRAELEREGSLRFRIASDSMSPLIRRGDTIEVVPLSEPPRRFDLVVFRESRGLVCHYTWHVNRSLGQASHAGGGLSLVTRALAYPNHQDLPVGEKDLLGKVVSHRLSGLRRLALAITARFAGRG